MLDRTPAQVLVQLGDVDGGCALLILGGRLSYPVVDIDRLSGALALTRLVVRNTEGDATLTHVLQALEASWEVSRYFTHIENNVTVPLEEVAVACSWNRLHLHVLSNKIKHI